MISKSTQGLVRSQTVESCQVIPSACQSDGVEEGPLVYGIEIVFSKEEWIRFSDISTRQEVVERLAAKLHGKSVFPIFLGQIHRVSSGLGKPRGIFCCYIKFR